jgi:hypothetical protein
MIGPGATLIFDISLERVLGPKRSYPGSMILE